MVKTHIYTCDYCGEQFYRRDRHGTRNKHFFCNRECAAAYKTRKLLVVCCWCDKKFSKKASNIKRTECNFCCHKCCVDYSRGTGKNTRNAKRNGIYIHRLLAEKYLRSELLPDEEVHHVDLNPLNNRPENLVVLKKGEHSALHSSMKVRDKNGRFTKTF
ncbi:HNH endonuclease [Salipaludibacillus sp. HK11]|uniref:HNH endonuclease n=1 Tax=Salipaludibacillus sp. HK11 TaxID=3394320 RepID=UPI0039FD5CA4